MTGETEANWKNGRGMGRRMGRGAGAFSLIELMAVVLIMGILGTVVTVVIGPKIFKARDGTTKTSMQVIQRELDSYFGEKTVYPSTLDVLEIDNVKDGWDMPFFYKSTPENVNPYMLSSAGKDKEHGTADDIDVWTMDSPTN